MQETLRNNFEKFYKTVKFDPEQFKEILWKFYLQGHYDTSPIGEDITDEEVAKMVEDQCFMDFIKSCIEDKIPEAENHSSDFVEIAYPCTAEDKAKCIAWPDRCEEVGGDGVLCKRVINLSKLCGVEPEQTIFVKDKNLLTTEEAATLSRAVCDFMEKKDAKC